MQALLGISRGIDIVNTWIGKASILFILASVLVSAGNALIRKVAPTMASNAWLELQWYLFGAAFMGAAAYTLLQNEHIRIDIFYGTRTRKTQHWIDLLGHIFFTLPFVLLMTWFLVPYTLQAFNSGQISTTAVASPGSVHPRPLQHPRRLQIRAVRGVVLERSRVMERGGVNLASRREASVRVVGGARPRVVVCASSTSATATRRASAGSRRRSVRWPCARPRRATRCTSSPRPPATSYAAAPSSSTA